MTRSHSKNGGTAIFCGTIATILYFIMIFGTLAHLEDVSGLTPFDMRPMGYTIDEAAQLLHALGDAGRLFYLTKQIPLDFIYPPALAATLIFVLLWLRSSSNLSRYVSVGIWLAVGATLADYAENAGIVFQLVNWPNQQEGVVHATSIASVAKASLTTASILLVAFVAFYRGYYRLSMAMTATKPQPN